VKITKKRILAVIPTSTLTQRQLLEGLLAYAHRHAHGRWQFHLDLRDLNRQRLKNLASWDCAAIVAYILSKRERDDFLATGLPAVFIEPTLTKPLKGLPRNIVQFVNDHSAEGETAADYFLRRGFTSFAFIGTSKPTPWSDARERGFVRRLSSEGYKVHPYPKLSAQEQNDFALESRRLVRWLKALPRQTAIFCVHDRRAQQVIATAAASGLRVPDDLGVLGVDNDELLCELTVPAISSIPVDDHALGEDVGRAIDNLLAHRPQKRSHVTRHTTVLTRTSTDTLAISNPFVSRALSHARAHFRDHPTLEELATVAGCSKTYLNLLARRTLGRTIKEELTSLQTEAAIELLANSRRSVEEVAQHCGFCNASHLAMRLKAEKGLSPRDYRRPSSARSAIAAK
jgi:LacI family transcriptional regulator